MKTFIDKINFGVKNWWVSLLLGLLYILIAICLMFTPLARYQPQLEIFFLLVTAKRISNVPLTNMDTLNKTLSAT